MIQKTSYLLPGTVKHELFFSSHISTNAKQTHWNSRNRRGSPKGDWGQAQTDFIASRFTAAFYFLLHLQEHALSLAPFANLQMGEENSECKRLFFPNLSSGGKGHIHDVGEVLLLEVSIPHQRPSQCSEKQAGGFANGTRGHRPEEQLGSWDLLLGSSCYLISTDMRLLWLPADSFSLSLGSWYSGQHHHLP